MFEAIYISKTQQTFKKIMGGHFYNLLCLIKNRKKPDSFSAHFEQYFDATMTRTDIRNNTTFKVVEQINPIGATKRFTKPKCKLCMEERLTILKNICDKRVMVINNNQEIRVLPAQKNSVNFS